MDVGEETLDGELVFLGTETCQRDAHICTQLTGEASVLYDPAVRKVFVLDASQVQEERPPLQGPAAFSESPEEVVRLTPR